MKEVSYVAVFEAAEEGGYSVTFPDVPGAISEGDDFSAAARNAREALELVLEALTEAGEALPKARPLEALRARRVGAIPVAIIASAPAKAARINVTMDEGLLDRLNRRASDVGQSRSAFIAQAVRRALREEA